MRLARQHDLARLGRRIALGQRSRATLLMVGAGVADLQVAVLMRMVVGKLDQKLRNQWATAQALVPLSNILLLCPVAGHNLLENIEVHSGIGGRANKPTLRLGVEQQPAGKDLRLDFYNSVAPGAVQEPPAIDVLRSRCQVAQAEALVVDELHAAERGDLDHAANHVALAVAWNGQLTVREPGEADRVLALEVDALAPAVGVRGLLRLALAAAQDRCLRRDLDLDRARQAVLEGQVVAHEPTPFGPKHPPRQRNECVGRIEHGYPSSRPKPRKRANCRRTALGRCGGPPQ